MKSVVEPPTRQARLRGLSRGWLAVALLVFGCKVSSLDESTSRATQNECESDGDCRGGRCSGGICRATSGEIESLLVEIVPAMETSSNPRLQQLSSVSYLKALDNDQAGVDLTRSGRLDLELNPIIQVNGTITLPLPGEDCSPPQGEARTHLKLRFTPSEKLKGLPGTSYSTDVVSLGRDEDIPDACEGVSTDRCLLFDINVPPGRYDIYLQVVDNWEGCKENSRLFRGRRIGLDAEQDEVINEAPLNLPLAEASSLELDVVWPRDDKYLDGWTIDIVDDSSGLPISTSVTLERAPGESVEEQYSGLLLNYTPVEYPPDQEGPGEALELVRLSPPESVIAPTVYIPRQALELFEKGYGTINHLTDLPPVVFVEGQIDLKHDSRLEMECSSARTAGGTNPCAVPMEVRIFSAERRQAALSGLAQLGSGTIAYYEQTTMTTDGLTFPVDLLPGDYRVIVTPESDPERPWASTEGRWAVSDVDKQYGKTVTVRPRARVTGEIRTPNRAGVSGFDVTLNASLEELVPGSFASQIGAFPFVPRASLSASAAEGAFSVRSDYGTFDLSIRPASETGFAWHVIPSVGVEQAVEELEDITLSWPVVYTGTVSSVSGGQLPGATIRAYAYLDANGELARPDEATRVVPVAQTRVAEDGTYRLLIPSRISPN